MLSQDSLLGLVEDMEECDAEAVDVKHDKQSDSKLGPRRIGNQNQDLYHTECHTCHIKEREREDKTESWENRENRGSTTGMGERQVE